MKSVKNYPTLIEAHEVTVIDQTYIIEFWHSNNVCGREGWEAWLTQPGCCMKNFIIGWPKYQPTAKDGHFEWTFDEFVELVCRAHLLTSIETFNDDLDILEEAYC